jgi:hypothetical protein
MKSHVGMTGKEYFENGVDIASDDREEIRLTRHWIEDTDECELQPRAPDRRREIGIILSIKERSVGESTV